MSAIDKTIWLIETHFGEPLSLDDMASHAGISRTYLSRIFPLATGYSISGYIRARRLTEAARALAAGAPDILAVALDAGYGSHEAFTRAFREQFGTQPAEVRRKRDIEDLNLVEPLPMNTNPSFKLADPVIERRPAMRLAGLRQKHDMNRANNLPLQWQQFQPYLGHVNDAVPGAAYGVVVSVDEGLCDYMTAMEVRPDADLPREFMALTVPTQRYAKFRHAEHISTIRSTISAIFADWLPTSGETQNEDLSFVEYYGRDFDASTGLGTIEIWIGLRD
jgi:AraC family transcriptional regulator